MIPSNIQDTRIPLFYGDVDNSHANYATTQQRTLIIGQVTAAGTAVPNVPVLSQGVTDAIELGGAGSMLALQTKWYRKRDTTGEVQYLPVEDAGAGIAAVGKVLYAGPPTEAGVISLYIMGVKVPLAVDANEAVADIATQLATAINAYTDLPVTAAAAAGEVTLTAKNKGICGNDIDLQHNLYGTFNGEVLPAGLTATITAMTGGATNPDIAIALANLSDQKFDFIVSPYTDTATLNVLKTFLDNTTGRWAWNKMIYGHVFSAHQGSVATLDTLGSARNDPHTSIMGADKSPTPSWLWAANVAGAAATSLRIDPARPLQTLELDVLAPPVQSRFTMTEQETLLHSGISTFNVADDGTVSIQRLITTYQKNKFGQDDDSYLSIETLFTLAYVLRFMQSRITTKFARMKLAANGTKIFPGSAIVTPNIIRADQIAAYAELEEQGLVQKTDEFKKELIVVQDTKNPNRVNVLWPGTLINQLNIFALLAQFRR